MRRRNKRLSRQLGIALAIAGVVTAATWFLRPHDPSAPNASTPNTGTAASVALLPQQAGPAFEPARNSNISSELSLGSLEQKPDKPLLLEQSIAKPAVGLAYTPPTKASAPAATNSSPTNPGSNTSLNSSEAFARAKSSRDAGDILAARSLLNDQLQSGKLTKDETDQAKATIRELNQRIVFSNAKIDADLYNARVKVQPGHSLTVLARPFDITPEFLARLNNISDPRRLRAGAELKAIKGPFHAVVSKSTFTMDFYLGDAGTSASTYITTFRVGLGSDLSTPTGTWLVTRGGKLVNPKFWGTGDLPPLEADDPKNPLGERWLQLDGIAGEAVGKEGYGIHGTIDPDSIGKNMSLGCIRLVDEDIKLVYDLLTDGKSKVVVVP